SSFARLYERPAGGGLRRVSMEGELVKAGSALPPLLREPFAILTGYNPRSMLLPRRVNESRHVVMRDLLILGCYRVEHCVGYEEEPEGVWREPAWLGDGIGGDEGINFRRPFRQEPLLLFPGSRPQLIVTDPTCDPVGKTYQGNWRVRN